MPRTSATSDSDIRTALYKKRFRYQKSSPNTLIINELGLVHARCRVDVAVINGCIHGYEIKSAQDSLVRLNGQIDIYRRALQKVTVVADQKHLSKVMVSVPDWCGVIEATQGVRGGIQLQTIRTAIINPDTDPILLAHLLWRSEVLELLTKIGYSPKELRRSRKELYKTLCEVMTIRDITDAIRDFMKHRHSWRDHLTPV